MKIDNKIIEHIAGIARLNLTEKEKQQYKKEFSDILGQFSSIKEVDTKNIEPSFQPVPITPHMREDNVEKSLNSKEGLSQSTHTKKNYFKGPKVI